MHLTRSEHYMGCFMQRRFRTKFANKLMYDKGNFVDFAGDHAFCAPRFRNVSSN